VWTEQQKLTASDASAGDFFGTSLSVDRDTAVIGAIDIHGSAYVFVRSGGVWTEQQKLTPSDVPAEARFGSSLSLDGDTAVIGAHTDDEAGLWCGSAYVFVRSGGVWTEQQKLTASDAVELEEFGYSVSVSGDTAVIGAYHDNDAGSRSGSAYVFVRSGGVWTEQQKLTASDAAAEDAFGQSVALAGDMAVVGAPNDDDAGSYSGSAYVFRTGLAPTALLRTAVTATNPVTPPLQDLLPLEMPRDLYIPDFTSGDIDPDPGLMPLVFYGLDKGATLRIVKTPSGDIQSTF
jgi:hypothetical protein